MNFSSLIGFIFGGAVLYFAITGSVEKSQIFADPHALILVFGGTLTVSLMSFPFGKLFAIAKLFVKVVFFNKKVSDVELVRNLIDASNIAKSNPQGLAQMRSPHAFATEGYQLIAEGLLSESDLYEVLQKRSSYFKGTYGQDAKVFAALAKYPPAFGLLGAVTGMVGMMFKLGTSGSEKIGESMGVALIATFWGIAVANLLLLPLADFYAKLASDDSAQRNLIVEGLMMLKRRESPLVVMEKLNSFLSIRDRLMGGEATSSRRAA